MLNRSFTSLYKSSSPDRPMKIDPDVEVDDASQVLSLFSSSWTLRVVGWDLEGRLTDLTWYLLAMAVLSFFSQESLIVDGLTIHMSLYI